MFGCWLAQGAKFTTCSFHTGRDVQNLKIVFGTAKICQLFVQKSFCHQFHSSPKDARCFVNVPFTSRSLLRLILRFQVVDMRWGVREEASIDHSTSELCLKEIKACNELSLGPTFVVCTCVTSVLMLIVTTSLVSSVLSMLSNLVF